LGRKCYFANGGYGEAKTVDSWPDRVESGINAPNSQ